jgi:Raf kinase inhibitor-like YbhB/YbcL family protein
MVTVLGAALICAPYDAATAAAPKNQKEEVIMSLLIKSPTFAHEQMIPKRHTCDGLNVSPSLTWSGVPSDARSLALIVDDPDAPDPAAPKMTWVHWVLYNLPPDSSGLMEGVADSTLPPGTLQGTNNWDRTGYGGPCPPIGKHRYFFKLYALDTLLPDLRHPTKADLEKAMHGHILAHATMIGLYQR